MVGLMEWVIVALLVLIAFGLINAPISNRQPVRLLEDVRPLEPVVPRPKPVLGFDFMVAVSLIFAAIACVFVLVLSQSGWV